MKHPWVGELLFVGHIRIRVYTLPDVQYSLGARHHRKHSTTMMMMTTTTTTSAAAAAAIRVYYDCYYCKTAARINHRAASRTFVVVNED